jgi:hypothetical protein
MEMTVRQKQPDRTQLNLLLPIGFRVRSDSKGLTTEKAKIEQSKKRLMADLERAGLLQR